MNRIYQNVNRLIKAEELWEEARNDVDEIIENIVKEETGIDIQVGTFLDCEDVYFEIQNMMSEDIDKCKEQIEIATGTTRRVNGYSFYFDENKL